jgi:hypothetical protein
MAGIGRVSLAFQMLFSDDFKVLMKYRCLPSRPNPSGTKVVELSNHLMEGIMKYAKSRARSFRSC